jgi:Flp pilus assembly protein TadG
LAAVEFVLVTPVLLLLMLATAEFVRAWTQYSMLAHAVRDATRHVAGKAMFGSTNTVVVTAGLLAEGRNLVMYGNTAGTGALRLPGLTAGQISVATQNTINVQITANYTYQPLVGATLPMFGYGADPSTAFTFTISSTMAGL